jgi:hypothetical protein
MMLLFSCCSSEAKAQLRACGAASHSWAKGRAGNSNWSLFERVLANAAPL